MDQTHKYIVVEQNIESIKWKYFPVVKTKTMDKKVKVIQLSEMQDEQWYLVLASLPNRSGLLCEPRTSGLQVQSHSIFYLEGILKVI